MRTCALLVAGLTLGFAPAPFSQPNSTRGDRKKLQGEWVRVRYTLNGKPVTTAAIRVVIAGDRLRYGAAPGVDEWALTLDATKKPKVLDFKSVSPGGKTFWGVYRLEGDTLTIWSRAGDNEALRPKDYGEGAGVCVEVFKRSGGSAVAPVRVHGGIE
jgi:uncharacterized protein (TIGR03067 family)